MSKLTSLIRLDREYRSFTVALKEQFASPKGMPIVVGGLSGGASFAFLVECAKDALALSGDPLLVLAGTEDDAARITDEMCDGGLRALYYPRRDLIFHNMTASHGTDRERLFVLSELLAGRADAVVATAPAALSRTLSPTKMTENTVSLSVGDVCDPAALCDRLVALGFCRVDMVESPGQFARRGGIVDIDAGNGEYPVRLEFFGDEIDRMAHFDPESQRVADSVDTFTLLPAEEACPSAEVRAKITAAVEKLLARAETEDVRTKLGGELAALRAGGSIPFIDKYLPWVLPEGDTLFSYFGARRTVVLTMGTAAVYESAKAQFDTYIGEQSAMVSLGVLPSGIPPYSYGESALDTFLDGNLAIHVNTFSGGVKSRKLGGLFGFRCRRTVSYGGNPAMLTEDCLSLKKGMYRTVIVSENRAGVQSVCDFLTDAGIGAVPLPEGGAIDPSALECGQIYLVADTLAEGYDLLMAKVAVLSMRRDSGRAVMAHRKETRQKKKIGASEKLFSYADLTPGDYVVHERYGIGQFEGISTQRVDGTVKDYITLRYADGEKLYVPCERLEVLGKYIGPRGKDGEVKLSHPGGTDWNRTKTKTKTALKNIAKDLIRIYAARQRMPGFAFGPDTEMEKEFDDAFEFEPTPSQKCAIEEIKADMARPVPMNRLLCGDVGFGKTEVALRAAFKAIVGGKQVAILVPTTILALQHYQTALSRMRGYAVNVEMLSRFRTPKEQAQILRKVERGEVDLLIGTHKILSKKLVFRDLGLLIIDEEQRFGVAQKEKLRDLGANVDTLTLSATPIPRTLNMAMNGISDMSVLDEAPLDRHPVQTYVTEHDDALLAGAMRREIDRGGQVLYLYNQVENIDLVAGRIMKELPDARVTYAHGQMDKDELEDIWQALVRGEIDILVCTTIIETGIDLPNANTLIIENADRMGLSQLHQIRGRVGRGTRQAYAYFTYRPGKSLSEVAEKRLCAIRDYAQFGAGFQIALRDLEIRGAGNLLGAEQHGYMEGVGYELYVRLLAEAVLEEQGKTPEPKFESKVDLAVSANIPAAYIESTAGRMEIYKKISLIRTPEDRDDILDECIDRFGEPPAPVMRLLDVSLIRALAAEAKVSLVTLRGSMLTLVCERPDLSVFSEVFTSVHGLSMRGGSIITPASRPEDAIARALQILTAYHRTAQRIAAEEEKRKKEAEAKALENQNT